MSPPNAEATSFVRSGALAGAASALVFTAVHHAVISNIWFSAPIMLPAGAACGALIAWSYGLVPRPSHRGWVRYNALYLAMLALLGLVSLAAFDPVTTVAAVIEANASPTDLIRRALPLSAAFALAMSLVAMVLHERSARFLCATLATSTVLMALLGLNISIIGLVDIPISSAYLVAELLGLTTLLAAVYAAAFARLERSRLSAPIAR